MKGKSTDPRPVHKHILAVKLYNPDACSGRGLSCTCNCDIEECQYAPECKVWQASDHGLVR
jgi:hypothetical protein